MLRRSASHTPDPRTKPVRSRAATRSAGLRAFVRDERGATAIEYGLIATLIALVIIGGLSMVSGANSNKYNAISNAVGSSM